MLTQPWLRDCSLFFPLIGWPRVPRPRIAIGAASLPSIILTLPFHSEFQIPQNGMPHSNFLSHTKVEPFAPNTNIKSTTGYGPSPYPSACRRRVVGRLVVAPVLAGLLLVAYDSTGASCSSAFGGAPPAPRRCKSRARSTSTCRYFEQGELRLPPRSCLAPSCALLAPVLGARLRLTSTSDKADVDVRSLIICTWFRGAHRRHGQ